MTGTVTARQARVLSYNRVAKKRRILTKLYAETFFSDSAVTRVDGPTGDTLGFKQFLAGQRPVAMTMMLQGTDFERLDRVDSRRARTAGSGSSIAGRASRRRRRPFIASGKARPHSAVD